MRMILVLILFFIKSQRLSTYKHTLCHCAKGHWKPKRLETEGGLCFLITLLSCESGEGRWFSEQMKAASQRVEVTCLCCY